MPQASYLLGQSQHFMRTQAGELNKDVTQDNSMLEQFTERPKTAKGKNEGYYIVTLVLLAQAAPST